MNSEMWMLIIGSILALVNSLIGLAIGTLFKTYAEMQRKIAENHTEIKVATTNLAHLAEVLREHTESDRQSFDLVREQQRDMHQDNRRMLEDIRTSLRHEAVRTPEGGRKIPMRPA
jgi:hypothetical protein